MLNGFMINNYKRCCSCTKPMNESKFHSCQNCYQYFKDGGTYIECNRCHKIFDKPNKYGTCYECFQILKNGGE